MVPSSQPNPHIPDLTGAIEPDDLATEPIADELPAAELESEPLLAESSLGDDSYLNLDPDNLDWQVEEEQEIEPDAPRLGLKGLSLKTKATALAVALGIVPVLTIGTAAYYFTSQSLDREIRATQKYETRQLEDKIETFIKERYEDIQFLAQLDIFANTQLRQVTTQQQRDAVLTRYVKSQTIYDRIAVIDLNGNILGQSQADRLLDKDHLKNSKFLQQVIAKQQTIILRPYKSNWTGKWSLEMAAPVKDVATDRMIGIIRTRINLESFNQAFKQDDKSEKEFLFFDDRGTIFVANDEEEIGKNIQEIFPKLTKTINQGKNNESVSKVEQHLIEQRQVLVSYAPVEELKTDPYNLQWGALIFQPTDTAFSTQRQLLLSMLLGTAIAALAVGAIAAYLANRFTRPLVEASTAVQKLGQGEFDTLVPVQGDDEMALLATNINQMSDRIKELLGRQQAENERSQLLKEITLKLSQFPQVEQILNTAVEEMRFALKTDRVIVYQFDENYLGNIIAESVADGWPRALGASINDPCFREQYVEKYRQGRVQATANIYEAGLTECHLQQLEPFGVQANLVAPIVIGSNRQLLGLLIAHQCDAPRDWLPQEIDIFAQLATQVGFALDRVNLLEQQKSEKEKLQRRALELLMQVDPVSQGDLTIRADVTEDEIGTIADSYNATIASLRKIVTQVQVAAKKMATTTSSNEASVRELSAEALQQTTEVNTALDRIQEMTDSIQAVAKSAEQAEAAVREATATVAAGDEAINRTVDGILAIRQTVSLTAKKVKQLGEASQKISKVVSLINSFADQTNLLALNAAIEAARAGEGGRGFAVVADEVGVLARQSAEATAEIESIVQEIQAETQELVSAMEAGSQQVVEGTKLAHATRQNLSKIIEVSGQISDLVQGIARAAVVQSQTSQIVAKTMSDVAAISTKTSDETTQVSESFKELLAVANELQASASQFKVN
jgi:methyl-accepting chemotaxis protein